MEALHNQSPPVTTKEIPSSFQFLPEEMIVKIFTLLTPPELGTAQRVCRKWRRISNDDRFWKKLHLEIFGSLPTEGKAKSEFVDIYPMFVGKCSRYPIPNGPKSTYNTFSCGDKVVMVDDVTYQTKIYHMDTGHTETYALDAIPMQAVPYKNEVILLQRDGLLITLKDGVSSYTLNNEDNIFISAIFICKNTLFAGTSYGVVKVYNLLTKEKIDEIQIGHQSISKLYVKNDYILTISFPSNLTRIWKRGCARQGVFVNWMNETTRTFGHPILHKSKTAELIDNYILIYNFSELSVCNIHTGKLLRKVGPLNTPFNLIRQWDTFQREGKWIIITTHFNGMVQLWDLATGEKLPVSPSWQRSVYNFTDLKTERIVFQDIAITYPCLFATHRTGSTSCWDLKTGDHQYTLENKKPKPDNIDTTNITCHNKKIVVTNMYEPPEVIDFSHPPNKKQKSE